MRDPSLPLWSPWSCPDCGRRTRLRVCPDCEVPPEVPRVPVAVVEPVCRPGKPLPGCVHCVVCGEHLSDPVSKERRMGPTCWERYSVASRRGAAARQ